AFFSCILDFIFKYFIYFLFNFLLKGTDCADDSYSVRDNNKSVAALNAADGHYCIFYWGNLSRYGSLKIDNKLGCDDDWIHCCIRIRRMAALALNSDVESVRACNHRPWFSLDFMSRELAPVMLAVNFIDTFKGAVICHRFSTSRLFFFPVLEDKGYSPF